MVIMQLGSKISLGKLNDQGYFHSSLNMNLLCAIHHLSCIRIQFHIFFVPKKYALSTICALEFWVS